MNIDEQNALKAEMKSCITKQCSLLDARISELTMILNANMELQKEKCLSAKIQNNADHLGFKEEVKHIKHELYGNGKPGLVLKVHKIIWTMGVISFISNGVFLFLVKLYIDKFAG